MKTILIILNLLFPCITLLAQNQVQKGCVKTRGRMVNGKHIPGHGLPGAVVTIKGRNNVAVKNNDGTFSFPVSSTHYFVQSVAKKDYELVDADVASKTYEHTANVQYFVMETPERLLQDKLEKERTIRRTLNKQLQKREEEIEMLKAENKISLQKYQQLLQELYAAQESNEKLISEMAERYAKLDYDQLDNFYRQVSNYIEEGDLIRADSLLKTRGDLNSQIDAHLQQGALIQQKKEELNQAESVLQFDKDELARRCYSYFENFKMQHQYDSAAYYIEKRAMLDTTNIWWQMEVAEYYQFQSLYHKAEPYYIAILKKFRYKADENPSLNLYLMSNLAYVYRETKRFAESEEMYKEVLEIKRNLVKLNPKTYEPSLVGTLCSLAGLYLSSKRFVESEKMYKEALEIYRKLASENSQIYEFDIALLLENLACVYCLISRFDESETLCREALSILRKLSKQNPQRYEPYVASALSQLAMIYCDTKRYSESENLYKESSEIRRRLAETNPQAYGGDLGMTLHNLAVLYHRTQRISESEAMHKECLEIRRKLAEQNPQTFESHVAHTLFCLAIICYDTQRISESEAMYKECLEVRRRLAEQNPETFEMDLAQTLQN